MINAKLENVKYLKYFGSMITTDARCTSEIKSRIGTAKAAFNKKKILFNNTLDLKLRKKLVKCYIWSTALYGVETWTLREVDQEHLESFEMCAGKEWTSAGQNTRKMKKYYKNRRKDRRNGKTRKKTLKKREN
jgi:hypothetical protein